MQPLIMWIEVDGEPFAIHEQTEQRCIDRANKLYGDNWKQTSILTLKEYAEELKA